MMLKGKIALITGASGGIGSAIARSFAAHGANLVLAARSLDALNVLADDLIQRHRCSVLVDAADNSDNLANESLYGKIYKKFGKLDILVANAGILGDGLLGMLREQDIRQTLDTNVLGTLEHMQLAARHMRRQKSGTIIVTSSIVGRVGNKGQTVYAASKAALIGATYSAAKELGSDGIRVNAIAPGVIETPMTADLSEDNKRKFLDSIALGRFGMAEEVADVALFLASDMARYVSGQIIGVDGAMVL